MKTQQINEDANNGNASTDAQWTPPTKERGLNEDEQNQRVNTDDNDDLVESENVTAERSEDLEEPKGRPFPIPSAN